MNENDPNFTKPGEKSSLKGSNILVLCYLFTSFLYYINIFLLISIPNEIKETHCFIGTEVLVFMIWIYYGLHYARY